MESSPILPINECPKGIPEEYLTDALPLKIQSVERNNTCVKVTVTYLAFSQNDISAFYLPKSYIVDGVKIKRVVLLRKNSGYDWDYDCYKDLYINQPIQEDLCFKINEKVRHIFITFQDIENEHNWATQQAPGSFCVLF